jgi:YggT family protein
VNALIFLIESLSRLYMLTFLLRLLLQLARGDFYNPVARFLVQITNPLVVPARRLIPSVRRFDMPTLVVLFVLQLIVSFVIATLRGFDFTAGQLLLDVVFALLQLTLGTYIFCIIIYVILSWLNQSFHPVFSFLGQVIEPVLRPARRLLPETGGIDVSPLITLIFLWAGLIFLNELRVMLM